MTMTKTNKLATALLAGIVSVGTLTALTPASMAQAEDVITLGTQTAFQTTAISPTAVIAYQLPASVSGSPTVIVERLVNGIWTQYAIDYLAKSAGTIDTFRNKSEEVGGLWQFRLRSESPDAVSPVYTVQVNKNQTKIGLGETAYTKANGVVFKVDNWSWSFNDPRYVLEKTISVEYPISGMRSHEIALQTLSGGKWTDVSRTTNLFLSSMTADTINWTITQKTAAKTSYRFVIPETDWTTGATSEVFTITGVKQSPHLSVSYSSATQKYKKKAVTLKITTKGPHTGKATIYDGSKKLATVKVAGASATYTLSKSLKKGNHKIKVKFVPSDDYAKAYNTQTSKAKTIKVK